MRLDEITADEFKTALKDPRAEFVRQRVEAFETNFRARFNLKIDSYRKKDEVTTGLYLHIIIIDLDDRWTLDKGEIGALFAQHFPLEEFNVESGVRDNKLIYQIWETNTP